MNQDEQERVDIVLSEIQSILAELSAIQNAQVEQTNAPAMVVSEFVDRKAEPRLESKSAIPLAPHRAQSVQNYSGINDAALAQEIEAGRLTVRDAVVAQQALIELLSASVAARRALCIASVDLAKALGVSLEGGTQ